MDGHVAHSHCQKHTRTSLMCFMGIKMSFLRLKIYLRAIALSLVSEGELGCPPEIPLESAGSGWTVMLCLKSGIRFWLVFYLVNNSE